MSVVTSVKTFPKLTRKRCKFKRGNCYTGGAEIHHARIPTHASDRNTSQQEAIIDFNSTHFTAVRPRGAEKHYPLATRA